MPKLLHGEIVQYRSALGGCRMRTEAVAQARCVFLVQIGPGLKLGSAAAMKSSLELDLPGSARRLLRRCLPSERHVRRCSKLVLEIAANQRHEGLVDELAPYLRVFRILDSCSAEQARVDGCDRQSHRPMRPQKLDFQSATFVQAMVAATAGLRVQTQSCVSADASARELRNLPPHEESGSRPGRVLTDKRNLCLAVENVCCVFDQAREPSSGLFHFHLAKRWRILAHC